MQSRYGNCMTDEVTEIPRCCSRRIQSDVAWRAALRPLTVPAIWMAPPNSRSFSVRVVLPASGCEMMANVRLLLISRVLTSVKIASQLPVGAGFGASNLNKTGPVGVALGRGGPGGIMRLNRPHLPEK